MRDRSGYLEAACEAMMAGRPLLCQEALERFRASAERRPLEETERALCAIQFERLRRLARSACEGIDSARGWLADLADATGGLDVYDRGGRQRVLTGLDPKAHRF